MSQVEIAIEKNMYIRFEIIDAVNDTLIDKSFVKINSNLWIELQLPSPSYSSESIHSSKEIKNTNFHTTKIICHLLPIKTIIQIE